jgi:hypothetical protein
MEADCQLRPRTRCKPPDLWYQPNCRDCDLRAYCSRGHRKHHKPAASQGDYTSCCAYVCLWCGHQSFCACTNPRHTLFWLRWSPRLHVTMSRASNTASRLASGSPMPVYMSACTHRMGCCQATHDTLLVHQACNHCWCLHMEQPCNPQTAPLSPTHP